MCILRVQSISFLQKKIRIYNFTIRLSLTSESVRIFGSLGRKIHNSYPVYIFLIENIGNPHSTQISVTRGFVKSLTQIELCRYKVTQIALGLKICVDLALCEFVKFQGHWKKKWCIHYFLIRKYNKWTLTDNMNLSGILKLLTKPS